MEKNELRIRQRHLRSAVTPANRRLWDEAIANRLFESELYRQCTHLFCFISFGDEVDTHAILRRALQDGKRVAVPWTTRGNPEMSALQLTNFPDDLALGHYGILTVKKERRIVVERNTIDLSLVPGLAFDPMGYRLGYGAGYYDRFFASLNSPHPTIGIGYDLQIVDRVPKDPHDVPCNVVLTDKRWLEVPTRSDTV